MSETSHFQTRDNTHVFEVWADPPTNTAEDGDNVEIFANETADNYLQFQPSGGSGHTTPQWLVSTSAMLAPTIKFDGTADGLFLFDKFSNVVNASDLLTVSAYTIIFPLVVHSFGTNEGTVYFNDAVVYFQNGGIYLKSTGKLGIWNWDGNADSAEVDIVTGTKYVVMARHSGGNIYISVNGGTEASAASGDTTTLSVHFRLADNTAGAFSNISIGDLRIWNTGNADGNSATVIADMMTTFVGSSSKPHHYYQMMRAT